MPITKPLNEPIVDVADLLQRYYDAEKADISAHFLYERDEWAEGWALDKDFAALNTQVRDFATRNQIKDPTVADSSGLGLLPEDPA